jgi:hypothetical protein
MDPPDRDKFYSPPDESDDDEYELEDPDPELEERRRKAILESLEPTIDIDEIYREADRDRGSEILENWVRNFGFRFRFQVKHLLVATAVLAIVMTLARFELFWTSLIVLIMLSVAGLYVYLTFEQQKQQAEAHRKREAVYARRRAQLAARAAGHVPGEPLEARERAMPETPAPPDEIELARQEAQVKEPIRFQFSLRQLIMAMTTAAVLLGLVRILGGPAAMATLLGIVALVGLFVYAMGYEPPQIMIFGWWFTLVLYVLATAFTAIWSRFA